MNKIPYIFFGALLASPAMAENISRTMDADEAGDVLISNIAGSVEVSGWSQDSVEITGTLGDDVEELVFERDGNEIIIKVKSPSSSSGWGRIDITSDLVVKVPQNSSLEVATVSADIEVAGVRGEQERLPDRRVRNRQPPSPDATADERGGPHADRHDDDAGEPDDVGSAPDRVGLGDTELCRQHRVGQPNKRTEE